MSTTRRRFLGTSAAGALMAAAPMRATASTGPENVPETGAAVVTLGTAAGPAVRSSRHGIATAVVVDDHLYVIDLGLGVMRQIVDGGLPIERLRSIFLTHLHSDHTAELPAMLLYNWGKSEGFTEPFEIVGPASAGALPQGARPVVAPPTPGTRSFVRSVLQGYAYDINIRVHDVDWPPLDELVRPREIALPSDVNAGPRHQLAPSMEPFEIYADDLVRVSATLVHHPPAFPSYGFRFETAYGTIALSGDTSEHPNVVALARGADLLVHESIYLDYYRERDFPPEFIDHLAESHTDPAGTGRVAARAGAGHLVLTHLGGLASDDQWRSAAATEYDGRITVASDGEVFQLG